MKEITIIGSGNVAFHLCKIFTEKEYTIQLYSRNGVTGNDFFNRFDLKLIHSLDEIKHQLVLICINDSEIPLMINQLDDSNRIAYTSGSVELNKLSHKANLGVFYPLQTFSKERNLDYSQIPFLIEANNEYFNQELFDLAWNISNKVEFADSIKRKNIHLAAVFANNFTNHLLYQSKNLLESKDLDWNLLKPLIQETVSKALELGPENAQTGPAKRNDLNTIESQMKQLNPELKQIYLDLTNSILENYGYKKL